LIQRLNNLITNRNVSNISEKSVMLKHHSGQPLPTATSNITRDITTYTAFDAHKTHSLNTKH